MSRNKKKVFGKVRIEDLGINTRFWGFVFQVLKDVFEAIKVDDWRLDYHPKMLPESLIRASLKAVMSVEAWNEGKVYKRGDPYSPFESAVRFILDAEERHCKRFEGRRQAKQKEVLARLEEKITRRAKLYARYDVEDYGASAKNEQVSACSVRGMLSSVVNEFTDRERALISLDKNLEMIACMVRVYNKEKKELLAKLNKRPCEIWAIQNISQSVAD